MIINTLYQQTGVGCKSTPSPARRSSTATYADQPWQVCHFLLMALTIAALVPLGARAQTYDPLLKDNGSSGYTTTNVIKVDATNNKVLLRPSGTGFSLPSIVPSWLNQFNANADAPGWVYEYSVPAASCGGCPELKPSFQIVEAVLSPVYPPPSNNITSRRTVMTVMPLTRRIGFHTDAPSAMVHIASDNSAPALRLEATNVTPLTDNVLTDLVSNGSTIWQLSRKATGSDPWTGTVVRAGIIVDPAPNSLSGLSFTVTKGSTTKPALFLQEDGKVGIGTNRPGQALTVEGIICASEIRVRSQCWPDYVFAEDFQLMPLGELSNYINKEHHLPGIPAAAQVEENGLDLGEMQQKTMQKLEEQTLYILQLDERNNKLQKLVEQLESRLAALENTKQ